MGISDKVETPAKFELIWQGFSVLMGNITTLKYKWTNRGRIINLSWCSLSI